MAYQEISVASVTDIPSAINSFMTANGISVPFTITAAISGTNNQLKTVTATHANGKYAKIYSPRLNGSNNNPFVPAPTKVHCFGGTTPTHWCAAVVEFGYNLYRHLYMGFLEKLGTYTGGEVCAATNFPAGQSSGNFTISYDQADVQYLFSACQNGADPGASGGVMVTHADNPVSWLPFDGPAGLGAPNNVPPGVALGGWMDSINDGLLSRAKSSYAGAAILVPVNLWASRGPSTADVRFSPIGRPPGVRMVRMDGLDPGNQIDVGNKLWRVFPQIRKTEATFISRGTWWNQNDTSWIIGLAYLEGDA